MTKVKYIIIFIIIIYVFSLTACGTIKGEYTQLSSPFGIDSSTDSSGTVSLSTDSSESDSTPEQIVNIEYDNNELVRVTDFIPDVKVDIKYSTADNFTKGRIYDFNDAYLRYGTVIKLKTAADSLRAQGYLLLIWDCYRPQSAQFTLFENAPDPTFVSDPNKKSSHSSGGTIDLTLIRTDGAEVEMPSKFDDFSAKADRDYSDVSKQAGENSKILENALEQVGFKGYSKEWWHYSDTDSYGFDDIKSVKLLNKSKKVLIADCNEYITLRKTSDSESEKVCMVPKGAELKPISWTDKYVRVIYKGYQGYVSMSYVK